ncbi:histidine phosphatase family protein [Desulfovibrio sp. Fe33]|uniref:histidine phosphatase family protein n=1 Tax=Desulfovibrio sp. Fe33 TaxID=3020842 RepID=UPI00234C7A95|nr:histidine phosphatase family protein [Desulfovibrio sp. Fe33]
MIVLLRHGRTAGGDGVCVGRTPLRLSAEGEAQARALAEELGAVPFARLYSSPAVRARDTLGPLAERLGLPVEILPEMDEIDMGAWDGLAFDDIRRRFPEEYAVRGSRFGSFRAPGGESFEDVARRAMNVLEGLADGKHPVLVATHAGVIRTVLCRVTDHPLDDLFRFKPGHARCTVLRREGNGFGLAAADLEAGAIRAFF